MVAKRVRLIPTSLRRSSSFQRDFEELFSLTEEQISKLAELGESKYGFDLPEESFDNAVKSLQVDGQKLAAILRVVDFLYDRARAAQIDEEESAEEVCEFAKYCDIKNCEAKIPAIRRLFAKKESYDHYMMVTSSKSAVVPTLSEVTTACDIRAVLEPGTDKIAGYVPVALVGMELEKAEFGTARVDFQLGEEELDTLLSTLTKAKRLLESLRKDFGSKILRSE